MRQLGLVLAGYALAAVLQTSAFGAGQFQFVSGDVKVVSESGLERVAAKGVRIAEHESVVTGRDSIAQLKMLDGAILVIQPESRATVEIFRYGGKEDGNERFVLRIHRGGFRGITGTIGHTNKENFRIETPIAQMGVRGTDHESYYFPQPGPNEPASPPAGAYNKVNVGAMYLRTAGGEVDIRPNQVAYAASAQSAPSLMPSVPEFFNRAAGVRRADVQVPDSLPAGIPTASQPVVVQVVKISGDINLSEPQSLPAPGPGPAASVAAFVEPVGGANFGRSGANLAVSPSGSALVDTGGDASMGVNWGSWQGPVTVSGNPTSGWAHFASASSTTSAAQLAAMPATLVTATYNYAGGPAPTNQLGTQGAVTGLSATVNFAAQTIANYNLNATAGATTWTASGNGNFAQFAGSGIALSGSCAGCSAAPSTAANGQANGVFVGNAAQGMLTAFGLKSATHALSGSAYLKR